MPQTIKVLSFDLDDTLWPCSPTILRAEDLLYQWLSDHVPAITESYDIYQLRDKRRSLFKRFPELGYDLTQLRLKSFELLAEEFELSDDWIKPAFDIFYEARQQVTLFDDVKPVLDELTKQFQLVSLTNGNADTVKTGVDHWFDFALNSASVGKLKSEPDIYRQVQKMTNISAQQMVHIGDDPLNDVFGAKLAGISAIWLNRDQKPWALDSCEPDAVITSLHELPELLRDSYEFFSET
ncbi:MAG: HAD-IA family hydrolase [Gammaproteobacteria bacterium]|nr:HAD-IA family hydrolase [Gammaproteobacteria bacterium]